MATFYIEAVENTNIALVKEGLPTIGTVKYGVNDTTCPNTYTDTDTTYGTPISLTAGQKCYWTITSTSTDFSDSDYLNFTSTAEINVGGNLSDLIGGESRIPRKYCFNGLFKTCTKLVDASNLILVNDFNSKSNCYYQMFYGCTSLTTAPALPATTLASYCYQAMFDNCTSLATAPELPATTLANNCYRLMFSSCISLTTAPALPATTLASRCYYQMFKGCTSLTDAPALPATTLESGCYQFMFDSCTSLTSPPTLSATTLADNCYFSMFYGCTAIKLSETQTEVYSIPYRIPSKGTGTVGTSSLYDMFRNTGGTFKGTPAINTTYYIPKVDSNVQLYDGDVRLYPVTKAENVMGMNNIYIASNLKVLVNQYEEYYSYVSQWSGRQITHTSNIKVGDLLITRTLKSQITSSGYDMAASLPCYLEDDMTSPECFYLANDEFAWDVSGTRSTRKVVLWYCSSIGALGAIFTPILTLE